MKNNLDIPELPFPDMPEIEARPVKPRYDNLVNVTRFTVPIGDYIEVVKGLIGPRQQAVLARKIDMPPSTLSQKLKGRRGMSIEELDTILDAMGYEVRLVVTAKDEACSCAFTDRGCTCKTFDTSNGGVL